MNDLDEKVTFSLHFGEEGQPSREVISVTYKSNWLSRDKYDLAFTFAIPLFEQVKRKYSKDIF